MKRNHYLLFSFIILISCTSDSEQTQNQNNVPDQNNVPNSVLNITSFTAKINTPIQTRDYSYHNQGYDGIFENPDRSKIFNGNINISYGTNSTQLNTNDIQITWRSSIDGILFEGNPNDTFQSEIEETLTKGIHTIFLEASIPNEDLTAKDSIILSNNLKLTALNTGKSVKLNWTQYEGNDFVSYKVYSEEFDPIVEINNINTLEYDVTSYSSLVEDKKYQIIVETNGNYNHVMGSNIESMHPGIFIDFSYYIHKIIKDPSIPKLYALVGNKRYDSDVYGLLIIDINSETIEVNSHILQNEFFADLDISPNGQYLFLCQENVDKITKLDLDTLEATTFAINTGGWGIHKIEVGNNNVLYCHRNPPSSGSTQFWIYNGNTGSLINGPTSRLSHGDIELDNTTNTLYAGESNTSNGRMYKFNVDGASINLDSNFPILSNGISYPSAFILLSDDNQNIFWENYQLDLDLNVIRTFNTNVKACSPNNNYLADFDNVYNYSDLSVVCEYPEFPEGTFVSPKITFSDDNNLIYCWANQLNLRDHSDPYWRAQTYIFKFEIE
nr:hypothetical protein [Allomuricauda sp.]